MVDVGQFLGLRAAKRAHRSTQAATQAGILADSRTIPQDAVRFSGRQIAILFITLAAIASVPILLYPWPPLSDYINHLARMHVIATVGSDRDLALFYQVQWQVIPNLMMDLIVPILQRVMNVYLAGQVYTIMSFVLILSGTLALNRQLYRHWSVLPLIAFPLLYNNVFLVGTMNYLFGIGLALWALASWVALRERALVLRLAVSTLFVLALFFCHLFAVGVYGLGLLAFELHRLLALRQREPLPLDRPMQRRVPAWADLVASGLPFVPVIPLLLMSPTWTLRWDFTWEFNGKLKGLFVIEVYSHSATFFLAAIVAIGALFAVRYRALRFHPFGWMLLAVGTATYLALPRVLFDTYMADQRLPIALAFMIIACAHLDLRDEFVRRGFATVLVLLLAVRAFEVQGVWRDLSRGTASFRDSVRQIERGSKVLVAYADPDNGDNARDLWLTHAACLAIIERSALVTTAFTVLGKQVMHVRRDYRDRVDTEDGTPPSVRQLLSHTEPTDWDDDPPYWSHWTSDYDYLYILFTDRDYANPDPTRLTPVFAGYRFVLYQINGTQLAGMSKTSD